MWHKKPEQLVAEAKLQLFQDRADIEHGALMTPQNSMAGTTPAPYNEQEVLIQSISPGRNLAGEWVTILKDLRATEPLYGKTATLSGGHAIDQESANPPA